MKYALIVLLLFIWLVPARAEKPEEWLSQPVSVIARNEPLGGVLNRISSNTGVTIVFDQSESELPVSISLNHTPLQQGLLRLFQHQNKSFIFNSDKKIIIIKSFGAKQYIAASPEQSRQSLPWPMSAEAIAQLHNAQYKEYVEEIEDTDRIDENGMTRGEAEEMQQLQYQEFLQSVTNGNSVLENGITENQLHEMHNQQNARIKLDTEDSKAFFEDSMMTRGQLHDLQMQQYQFFQANLADGNILLEDGFSNGALHEMHLQQYNEYIDNRYMPIE